MTKVRFFKDRELPSWLPFFAAAAGAILYLIQAVLYAFTSIPGLDEGSYLLKGLLFVRGVYEPFEAYGPFTNKAPFAYLIPGFAQAVFGEGLRTGRFFYVLIGLLMLWGIWIAARRWAGNWAAAGSIWVFALSSYVIKTYSVTVTEVLISCMLAWMCVFVLGSGRPLWQIMAGSLLAALAVLTRQNMAPVLALLVLYVFWEHGWQKGAWSLLTGAAFFVAVNAYYWPGILSIWAPWLPESLTPFLDPFRLPADALPIWDPSIDFWNRLNAFFQGIRYHFVIVVGSGFVLLLWPRRADWKSTPAFRAAVFLAVSYSILFLMHAWAAVASQYESYSCVFCFSNYLAFFDLLGLLLVIIVLSQAQLRSPSRWMQAALLALVVLLCLGIGYSLFESIGRWVYDIPAPRMRDGRFLPGTTGLAELLMNLFDLSLTVVKRMVSSGLGLAAGLLFMVLFLLKMRRAAVEQAGLSRSLVYAFLAFGFFAAPLVNLRGAQLECRENLISANEQLGAYLAHVIPADSLVYWDGGLSFTPMLYVPDVRIFPPQINSAYTFREGGDADTVYRLNHWNAELSQEWKNSADVFIIEEKRYSSWKEFLDPQTFAEYQRPPVSPSCLEGSGIRIFHRQP